MKKKKKLIRATITIPEVIYRQAKIHASYCNESFSSYVVNSLYEKIKGKDKEQTKKYSDPLQTLGQLSMGIKKIYNKRSDLYEDHLKRKMGY